MHGFTSIRDQDRPIRLLKNFLKKETPPHALLFSGIKGVGKKTAAMAFAMAQNCERRKRGATGEHLIGDGVTEPCCRCGSCKKIISGSHPDILHIAPSGGLIKIGQIRDLLHALAMKPFEARCRVVVISDAHEMNAEAANGLLKALEEPPARTILILTAQRASDLLPTILSRCQHIRFMPVSRSSLAAILIEGLGIAEEQARILATMAGGSVTKVLAMADGDWIDQRNWLIRELEALDRSPVWRRMALAETLAKEKDRLEDFLEIMKTYYRDIAVCRYRPNLILNMDLSERIEAAARQRECEETQADIHAVQNAQDRIRSHANARLTLERLILQLTKIDQNIPAAQVRRNPGV